MKHKFGVLLMILGAAMVLSSALLLHYNRQQDTLAGEAASERLNVLVEEISRQEPEEEEPTVEVLQPILPPEMQVEEPREMKEIIIDGYAYIGYLSVPKLNLELPVISDWSNSKLQKAPCRYHGTVQGKDLVIMAHNYARHFGFIGKLEAGDTVVFTDADGNATWYEVALQEILQPAEVEEMVSGAFDLTLFTCTYGGRSRVTVRCNQIN